MIPHFLKVAFRVFVRYRSFTITNIFGLAVGIMSSIIIFLYVDQQISSASGMPAKSPRGFHTHAGTYAENLREHSVMYPEPGDTLIADTLQYRPSSIIPQSSAWIIKYKNEFETGKNRAYGYMLTVLAFIILIVSCLNFINLTTARSAIRIKEVIIRKISGSERKTIVRQFLLESSIMAVIAVILALFLTELVLPLFNRYMEHDLTLSYLVDKWGMILVTVFILAIGIVSGLYPAYHLSAASPAKSLHQGFHPEVRKGNLRWLLVFFQFIIATVLTAITVILFYQYRFMLQHGPVIGNESMLNPLFALRDSAKIFMLLSAAAVWIACFGLCSLIVFRFCTRKQEIGIRKTLGAGSIDIFLSEWKRIGKLVLFSSVISWPVVYVAVRAWFSDHNGYIGIHPLYLLIPTVFMLVIAVVASAYPVYLATTLDPGNYHQHQS